MTKDPSIIQDWFNQIENNWYKLTKWEESFVESVQEQFQRRGSISDRQEEILERIYAEKT